MQIIYPGYGLEEFHGVTLTKKVILEKYGPPTKVEDHNYSIEMRYEALGLRFYYIKREEAEKKENVEIVQIAFRPPYECQTEEGITLGKSTMQDVFNYLGKENWLTASGDKYWWVDYSGISFYVERDQSISQFPFHEEKHINKPIMRITVPVRERDEDFIRNEDGNEIRTADDFCIDGGDHELIKDEERGERICSKCGLVFSERMISMELSGQRAFSSEERSKREQHGSPINALTPDIGMTTMIDKHAPMSLELKKAVKWDSRYTWKQRNMIQATSEIKRIGELLNLPQRVKELAITHYRQAYTKGLLKGRSIKAMVAACLYYACGSERVPRTLGDIVQKSDSNLHDITRSYQTMIRELNLPSPTLDPGLLVSKFTTDLGLPHEVETIAQKILEKYEKTYSLSGKDPKGLVAAAIYLAAILNKMKLSQTKIAKIVGITEVTLRNRLKEMQKFVRSHNIQT
jgi:transcription initiation factor TFIIB